MTVEVLNQTLITPVAGAAYVPFEMYVIVAVVALICFFGSIWIQRAMIITAIIAEILFLALAWMTPSVTFSGTLATGADTTTTVIPWMFQPYDPYIVWIWMAFFLVGIVHIFYIVYKAWNGAAQNKKEQQENEDMMYKQEHIRRMGGY